MSVPKICTNWFLSITFCKNIDGQYISGAEFDVQVPINFHYNGVEPTTALVSIYMIKRTYKRSQGCNFEDKLNIVNSWVSLYRGDLMLDRLATAIAGPGVCTVSIKAQDDPIETTSQIRAEPMNTD